MSQATYGLILAVFLIFGAFTLYIRFFPYRQEKRKHQRFKLFKVRDDWVYLVPQGKIQKDDPFFLWFYDVINFFIRQTDTLSLACLVYTLSEAQHKQLDPAEQERLSFIEKQLKNQPPEVAKVIQEFYQAVFDILLENSRMLRILIAIQDTKLKRFLDSLTFVIRPMPSSEQLQAYRYAQKYAKAAAAIGILMVSLSAGVISSQPESPQQSITMSQ